jgi:Leucine-rich repeat (LRR) protein
MAFYLFSCQLGETIQPKDSPPSYIIDLENFQEIQEDKRRTSICSKQPEYLSEVIIDLAALSLAADKPTRALPVFKKEVKDVIYCGPNKSYNLMIKKDEDTLSKVGEMIDITYRENINRACKFEKLSLGNILLHDINTLTSTLHNAKELSLRFHQSHKLLENIGQFTKLEVLDLADNKLHILPSSVAQLTNLISLCLVDNQLCELPENIGNLIKLESLDLLGNQLSILPSSATQLTKLTYLDLSNNQFKQFPLLTEQIPITTNTKKRIDKFVSANFRTIWSSLKILFLKNNQLQKIPDCWEAFPNLKQLYLDGNQLQELPVSIAKLNNLSRLGISHNHLKELPFCMKHFVTRARLNASKNLWYKPADLVRVTPKLLKKACEKYIVTASPHFSDKLRVSDRLGTVTDIEVYNFSKDDLYCYCEEGKKYIYFISLEESYIPICIDFTLVTLANMDEILAKLLPNCLVNIVTEKQEKV